MIRSGSTGHLVGLVVHEGQVDGHHQQQVPNAFPCRSFANVDRAVHRLWLHRSGWYSGAAGPIRSVQAGP